MPYLNNVKHKVVPAHAMKVYRGVVVQLHPFLTLALDAGEPSASQCLLYPSGKKFPGTYWTEGLVGPWANLDVWRAENVLSLPGLKIPQYPKCSRITIPTTVIHTDKKKYFSSSTHFERMYLASIARWCM